MARAVVLLSGGLDSTVCMAVAESRGMELFPMSFNYRQRQQIELQQAKKIAEFYRVSRHLIIETNMDAIGGSALTDWDISVPAGDVGRSDVPATYVPGRNLIFLSYALAYAETIEAEHVFIGVNSIDYSGYPDCRPEFIQRFQALSDFATKSAAVEQQRVKIETPLQELSKKEIILLGLRLQAPIALTNSCYQGGEKACGICDSCLLRLKGFSEAGMEDPIAYERR